MAIYNNTNGKLGFGLMRLPKKGEEFDLEQINAMVDRFMEAGFTYFDTAWAYEWSEEAMRKSLVERYPRESYQVATKLSAWIRCETREDAMHQFDVSLERSGLEYFDYYLLHNLGMPRSEYYDRFDLWSFVQELKAEGKARHIGISYHGQADELEQILDAHPEIEFVQIQLNYADMENDNIQSRKNYELITARGIPVIVMEPVKGGLLAAPPAQVEEIFRAAEPETSPAVWALRFAADLDNVLIVLSGMSSLEQMEDNLKALKGFRKLTPAQAETLREAREALASIPLIPCTSCNYCAKVCPMNIGVSGTLTAMNYLTIYGNLEYAKGQEGWLVVRHGKARANECIECGACEEACPQHIEIRAELRRAVEALGI